MFLDSIISVRIGCIHTFPCVLIQSRCINFHPLNLSLCTISPCSEPPQWLSSSPPIQPSSAVSRLPCALCLNRMHSQFTFPRVGPRIIPCPIVSVSTFTFSTQYLLLRWVLSFADPCVLSLSLHLLNVLLSALSHTMSVLPTVETLPLKTSAVAFQSMKTGLIIAKCLSCLIVIVMLSEARVHWFDTIWVTLWALLVVTQSQSNLVDDVLFYVTVTNDVRHLAKVYRKIRENQSSLAVCHGDVRHLAASVLDVFPSTRLSTSPCGQVLLSTTTRA